MPGERYEVSWQPRRGADRIFRNIEAGSFLEASIKCAELRGIKKVVNNKEGGQMKACFHKATCKYFNEELDSGECACRVRFPDLSDGQKEQIIEIANSLPTK